MFCFTVLSSFTLFTWRKLKVHYRRKEVWEQWLWSEGRQLQGRHVPRREAPGLCPSWRAVGAGWTPSCDWGGAGSRLVAWGSPCLTPGASQRPAPELWRGNVWLGGGERSAQPLWCYRWDLEDQEKEQPPSPVAVRGQEEELGTTSGGGSDPAKPAHLGSAPLRSSGASFSVIQEMYYGSISLQLSSFVFQIWTFSRDTSQRKALCRSDLM